MKAVQVDALAVNVREDVIRVNRLIHVPGGIERDRRPLMLSVSVKGGEANVVAPIMSNIHPGRVTYLDSVPSDISDVISLDDSLRVAMRAAIRMRPDGVAKNIPNPRSFDKKVADALLEQYAASGIVPAVRPERAGVIDSHTGDFYLSGRCNE
jgi:hypothetical protein